MYFFIVTYLLLFICWRTLNYKFMKKHTSTTLFTVIATSLFIGACNNSSSVVSYDGRVYDISVAQDKSLIATSIKNGVNYELTISGSGDGIDYSKSTEVPWNPIAKKIQSVEIESGIEYIGDYYFASIALSSIFLPETVVAVGEHTFNPNTVIYTYGQNLTNISNNVYVYSGAQPTTSGDYFHMENGEPVIWPAVIENPSFLFIGNSFTWRQGSLEDPAVPRYFKAIANNLGQNLTYDFVVESSYTLTSYADATDRLGSIVDSKIKNNKYDYVILQEQSTRPLTNYQAFEDAVKALKSKIDKYQTKCKTILYETWGSPASMNSYGGSVQEMEARLRTAYEKCAKAANCSVNYIGKAFTYAYVNEGINIYADDNRHQSNEGAYFSAACHVRSIFGLQVSKCTNYCGLNQTECKSLLGIADKII